jgi:hypothetical protein
MKKIRIKIQDECGFTIADIKEDNIKIAKMQFNNIIKKLK